MNRFSSHPRMRLVVLISCLLVLAGGLTALGFAQSARQDRRQDATRAGTASAAPAFVDDRQVPAHREPPPPPSPPPAPAPPPAPKAPPAPAPAAVPGTCGQPGAVNISTPVVPPTSDLPYRGLGAWIDEYDFCIRGEMDARATVAELSRRGVKTLYLQTGRWKEPADIVHVASVTRFLDESAAKGIAVVGWYLPGFGDLDRDIRRSLAVMRFVTPSGNRFAGFAADIETREEVGGDKDRFNQGIAEYSRRLRAAVPAGTYLAGITVDAKNNERAPYCAPHNFDAARCRWGNHPWAQMGESFDLIMPMAYWTASKSKSMGCGHEMDAATYIDEVVQKTKSLMGRDRPMHVIGGIADCLTVAEVRGYVDGSKRNGGLGVSLYDYLTTHSSPNRDAIWSELSKF